MKLLIIIVQDADAKQLRDALSNDRIPFTKLASTGGFLRQGVCTFVSGVADHQVQQVKQIVDQNSRKRTVPVPPRTSVEATATPDSFLNRDPPKVDLGGATVFELKVEEFVKL
jgi:uncharacterized protein YaaQ